MRLLYLWSTRLGPFYIAQSADGRFHPLCNGESLGSYASPEQEAADLAGGHAFTAASGIDTATLGIPEDLRSGSASGRRAGHPLRGGSGANGESGCHESLTSTTWTG